MCSGVVGLVGVQSTKYSLDVIREYGRKGESCNWNQSSCLQRVWNMHAADVKACLWCRRCFCQIELVNRSCWSFSPPEIASRRPFSSCPKTVFPRCPSVNHSLIRHLLIYQRTIRGCSQQILGDLTLRIRTERVRSTIAWTCKLWFYLESKWQKQSHPRSALP